MSVRVFGPGEIIEIGGHRRSGVRVMGGGGGGFAPVFWLRADANVDAAAPLGSPLAVEIGSLVIVDTNNKLSKSGGKFAIATGGVAAGDPGLWDSVQRARLAGRSVVASMVPTTNGVEIGWDSAQTGSISDAIRVIAGASSTLRDNAATIDGGFTISAASTYLVAVVLRSAGWFGFLKGGIYTNWTLVWVSNGGAGNSYPAACVNASTSVAALDTLRGLDFPAPFDSEYGLATITVANPATDVDYTATADALHTLEFTLPVSPSSGDRIELRYRVQDANNYWVAYLRYSGTAWDCRVDSVDGGLASQRINVTGVGAPNAIRIICEGSVHNVYTRVSTVWTKRNGAATVSHLNALTTIKASYAVGSASRLTSWPRTLPGAAAAMLDAAFA